MKTSKFPPSLCFTRCRAGVLCALLIALFCGIGCTRDPAVRKKKFLESGNRFFAEQHYDEAIIQYRNAVQVDPQFADAYYRLGLSLLQTGDWIGAGQALNHAVENDGENLDSRLRYGNLLLGAGQFDDAIAQAGEVLKRNPKVADAHMLLGQVHQQRKEFDDAKKEFNLAMELAPGDPAPYTDLALTQLLNHEFDDSEKNFRKAVGLKPEEPQLTINLSNFYRSVKKQDRAEQVLKEGVAANAKAVGLRLSLADLYFTEGRAADYGTLLEQIESQQGDFPEGRRNVAEFYFSHQQVQPALDRYLKIAGTGTPDQSLVKRIAECYLQLARWPEAESWIAKQDRKDKKKADPEFRLLQGRAMLGEYRLRDAIAEFQAVIKEAPAAVSAHYFLAQAYLEKGDSRAAKDAMTDALRVQPGYLPAFIGLGGIALQENDTQAALQYANQIVSQAYWMVEGHLLAGNAYFQKGDLPAALQEYDIAASLDSRNVTAQQRRGLVLTALGRYAESEKAFEDALLAAPNSAQSIGGLVSSLLKQGKVDRARARIDQQIDRQPGSFEVQLVKGEFCLTRKEWPCAEQSFRRVIELNPYAWVAYGHLAHIYKSTNRLDDAVRTYEMARQRVPDILSNYVMLGVAYEAKADFVRAQQVYQDALKVDPNFVPAQNNLAWLYLQHGGSVEEALKLAQRAHTAVQGADDPHIADTLAWAYYKKGWYASATELLEPVVTKNTKSPTLQFHLGMSYLAEGKSDLSRKALQAALQSGLSGEDARQAQEGLSKLGK